MPTSLTIAGQPIDLDTLLFVEAEGKHLHLYTPDERLSAPISFADMLLQLPAGQFMRVHKRYAINLAHIHKVEPEQVLMGDKIPVPISPSYREALRTVWRNQKQGE
jgi:two-component system, LytTR family, response regulator